MTARRRQSWHSNPIVRKVKLSGKGGRAFQMNVNAVTSETIPESL